MFLPDDIKGVSDLFETSAFSPVENIPNFVAQLHEMFRDGHTESANSPHAKLRVIFLPRHVQVGGMVVYRNGVEYVVDSYSALALSELLI